MIRCQIIRMISLTAIKKTIFSLQTVNLNDE